MANFNAWMGDTATLRTWQGDQGRSISNGNIIQDKPTTITIRRRGVAQAAQVVRLDTFQSAKEADILQSGGLVSNQWMILLGYKGHPVIADTDIESGDTFNANGYIYRVIKVEANIPNRLLAFLEEVDG